MKTEEFLTTEN
jgi:hypothetical protein